MRAEKNWNDLGDRSRKIVGLRTALAGSTALALSAVFAPVGAFAEPASPAVTGAGSPAKTANAGASSATLGEVVVTARRRAESLQEVPQAVIAFDQQTLTRKAVSNMFDLGKIAPGVSVDGASGVQETIAIRGRGLAVGAAAGSVETYFADVPLSPPYGMPQLPPLFFDLQSAQVLKGPQGTLFGRNTTGGALVLVPQAPENRFGGYLRLQAGDFADKQAEGAINVPVVEDKVLLRVAGFIWQRHGYGKTAGGVPDESTGKILPPQDFDNQNIKEFRASLLIRPTDQLTNTTIVAYHWEKTRNSQPAGWNLFGPAILPGSVALPAVAGQPIVYRNPGFGSYGNATLVDLNKPPNTAWATVNTTTYEVTPDLTIKNILGYILAKGYANTAVDSDGSVLPVVDLPLFGHANRNEQLTEELQVQGKALDGRLTYTLGGLIDRTFEPGDRQHMNFSSLLFLGSAFSANFTQSNVHSKAVYSAGTFKLTDQLTLSAGYRYTWDRVYQKAGSLASLAPIAYAGPGTSFSSFFQEFSGATYNADLQWRPTTQNMLYGGYRHGYKRGGFNPTVTTSVARASFGPEKVDDYFVGSKNDFTVAGMKGRLNAEAFYDKYTGAQNAYVDFDFATGSISSPVLNVPSTKYYGVDVDFALDPTDWLTLTGNYAYLHAKYDRWPDTSVPGSTVDLSVNPVTYAPEHKYSVTARFHAELPNDMGEVALAPTASYQSKTYTYSFSSAFPESQNIAANTFYSLSHPPTPFFRLNQNLFGAASTAQRTLVDLRLEWNRVMGSKVDLAAQVTNLTKVYYSNGQAGGTLPFGAGAFGLAPPRMFFVEARTTF